jgi:hypothetical protein
MQKKCALCHILLDVPCAHPGCPGHHNERRGDVCVYCATHQREQRDHLHRFPSFYRSSLADMDSDWTEQDERALLGI